MSFAFCVFSLPRAGSTWVSNWLSSGSSICWHDPIATAGPKEIEHWASWQDRPAGICCTGTWLDASWRPQVPILLLERDRDAVNRAMTAKGLPELPGWVFERWAELPYDRVTLPQLMNERIARRVHSKLLPSLAFDLARYHELQRMNVQPSEQELQAVRAAVAHYNSRNEQRT